MAGKEVGVVCVIEDEKSFGEKGFRVRVFVLEQKQEKWTNYVPMQLTGDACSKLDDLNIGDKIEVTYRLNGRKYEKAGQDDRYFLNAEATAYKMIAKSTRTESQQDDEIPF